MQLRIDDEEFALDLTPELLGDVQELLGRGILERATLREILRQVQFVTDHHEQLRAEYAGRIVLVADTDVVFDTRSWADAVEWARAELDSPYYAVEFPEAAGQEALASQTSGGLSSPRGA